MQSDVKLNRGYNEDCRETMSRMPDNFIDTIITDPPYELGFMGKSWDSSGIAYDVAMWRECLRVAKPGAMLLSFGGSRTFHRVACAIEDAGWIIRDTMLWIYGSGFPKSHDISKAIDKESGAKREVLGIRTNGNKGGGAKTYDDDNYVWDKPFEITAPSTDAAKLWNGYGTALKPAFEPIIVAMKPLDGTYAQNAQKWGVAGLWIDGGRVEANGEKTGGNGYWGMKQSKGWNPNNIPYKSESRQQTDKGRWPANILHDGSDEVVEGFPVTKSGKMKASVAKHSHWGNNEFDNVETYGDTGSAARFFYCAKASKAERGEGNDHPTVKPLALIEYLCKLTKTPTGGIVFDPFGGSGTTALAAIETGRDYIICEKDKHNFEIACSRVKTFMKKQEGK